MVGRGVATVSSIVEEVSQVLVNVTVKGKTDTNAFPLNGQEKRLYTDN